MYGLCTYADDHDKTLHQLLDPESHWSNFTSDKLWGSRRWEAQILEAYGLLDTAMDRDEWPREEQEVDAVAKEVKRGAGSGNDDEDEEELQFSEENAEGGNDGSENDNAPMDNPCGCWGAPGRAGDA